MRVYFPVLLYGMVNLSDQSLPKARFIVENETHSDNNTETEDIPQHDVLFYEPTSASVLTYVVMIFLA